MKEEEKALTALKYLDRVPVKCKNCHMIYYIKQSDLDNIGLVFFYCCTPMSGDLELLNDR
jgi:hypothetical protein